MSREFSEPDREKGIRVPELGLPMAVFGRGFGIYFNSTNIHTTSILISQVHHSCLRALGRGNFRKVLCFSQFLTLNTKITIHFV